jgi:copper chaperone
MTPLEKKVKKIMNYLAIEGKGFKLKVPMCNIPKEVITVKSIKIKGMNCQHCVMAVTRALNAVDGVKNVQVDLKKGLATYEEATPVDLADIRAAVKKAGYDVG